MFSDRIKKRANNLVYGVVLQDITQNKSDSDILIEGLLGDLEWGIKVQIDPRGRISKLSYNIYNDVTLPEIAIFDTIIEFCHKKTAIDLFDISWRELENYLRDTNKEASIPGFSFIDEEWMESFLKLFAQEIIQFQIKNKDQKQDINFLEINLIKKIKIIQELLERQVSPILSVHSLKVELMDVQQSNIWMKFTSKGSLNIKFINVVKDSIKTILQIELNDSNISLFEYPNN